MPVFNIPKVAVLGLAAASLFGATPVARVIGARAIEIDGITTPQGIYAPVAPGNEIRTEGGVAVVQFRDGSKIAMEPNSTIRVESAAAGPQVRIVRGAASYTITSKSHVRVVDGKGEALNRVLDGAMPQAMVDRAGTIDAAVMYRAASRTAGGFAPTSAVAVGQFTGSGIFHAATSVEGAYITTPSGLRINLNTQTVNGQTVYTVASITQTVGTQQLTVTPSSLVGVTVQLGATTEGGTSINLVPAGSTQPLDPATVSSTIQSTANQAYQSGLNNGTIPKNTPPPQVGPIVTGTFSASAP